MTYSNDRPKSLRSMYDSCTVDDLKRLGAHLIKVSKELGASFRLAEVHTLASRLPSRKAELIEWIERLALNDAFLEGYYKQMSSLEKSAVREVVHSKDGYLDSSRFRAKYGAVPQTYSSRYSCHSRKEEGFPYLSFLLASGGIMPPDLQSRMKKFVPKPEGLVAPYLAELPEEVKTYGGRETAPVVQHNTEHAAQQDVMAILQLVDMGKVNVSAKTGKISQPGASAIRRVLSHGDFYPEETEAEDKYDVQMGPLGIRPFAWGMLLQAGNLAQTAGSKLELTRVGRAALKKEAHEILATLWQRWVKNKLLHELNRIEVIKGQKSAKHPLAAAENGRSEIAQALSELEVGKWVQTSDFLKFLIAGGHRFDIVRNDWVLYIADANYGSFGYDHVSWEHANGRFARAFLLEYAATLGLIDVALVPPWGAMRDHYDLWGADELSCLSRYDGLYALRLSSLGAWILGKSESYAPAFHDEPVLRVLPNMEVTMMGASLPSSDALFLDRICERASERVWRLSLPKLLLAVEEGVEPQRILAFIDERSRGDLPQPVRGFLDDVAARARKVKDRGEARLVECADASLAQLIANDSRLKSLCFLAGERRLAVPRENEAAFRKALRELGYVIS